MRGSIRARALLACFFINCIFPLELENKYFSYIDFQIFRIENIKKYSKNHKKLFFFAHLEVHNCRETLDIKLLAQCPLLGGVNSRQLSRDSFFFHWSSCLYIFGLHSLAMPAPGSIEHHKHRALLAQKLIKRVVREVGHFWGFVRPGSFLRLFLIYRLKSWIGRALTKPRHGNRLNSFVTNFWWTSTTSCSVTSRTSEKHDQPLIINNQACLLYFEGLTQIRFLT